MKYIVRTTKGNETRETSPVTAETVAEYIEALIKETSDGRRAFDEAGVTFQVVAVKE